MSKKLICGILVLIGGLAAAQSVPSAPEILAKAKQASGGNAWDTIRTLHTTFKFSTGGLTGQGESWEDTLTGRYVDRVQLGPASETEGFDGATVWSQDTSGQPRAKGGDDQRQAAVNEAFRRSLAYWFPHRRVAHMEYAGKQQDEGKSFYVLRITPQGGRPFDLWVNAGTYLFERLVEKGDTETRTVFFSDYRAVQGLTIPFAQRSTNGESRYDQFTTIEKIQWNEPVQAASFAMPLPPPADYTFAGGKTVTTIPFELINNHIYVRARIDGQGPYRMLCDTGGANVVTPTLARSLGLKSEGALQGKGVGEKSEDFGLAKTETLQVGDVTLRDQLFYVFPMEQLHAVEGIPVNGLVGYEIFKRFVVKVDYERHEITLTEPASFAYHGDGIAVPFQFNNNIPQVDGEIDGIAGKFDIDTGSRASLDLMKPFAEKHDLAAHYGTKLQAVTGWGVGGAARSLLTRAKLLRLGKVQVAAPVTALSLQSKGAFAGQYAAGNVGAGVLKRFNITFDYPHQQLFFEPNANYAKPDVYDRSGMWLNVAGDAFELMDVTAGGPAALAGLKIGDRISAIDGHPAVQLTLPQVRDRFRSDPPGTHIPLTVESGGRQREVVLVLQDLI